MINKEDMLMSINYIQRISYCLKKYYLEKTRNTRPGFVSSRVINLNIYQTLNLYRDYDFSEIVNEDDMKIIEKLGKYSTFIFEKSFIEFQYDLDNSIYRKKEDYVNAKLNFIANELKPLCYKLESAVFEKFENKNNLKVLY